LPGQQITLKIKLLIENGKVKDRIDSNEYANADQYDKKCPVHSFENYHIQRYYAK
jgi:hypothetical protein